MVCENSIAPWTHPEIVRIYGYVDSEEKHLSKTGTAFCSCLKSVAIYVSFYVGKREMH